MHGDASLITSGRSEYLRREAAFVALVAAGLAGIAVEAGRVMIVDRDAVIELADKEGIFIVGRGKGGGEDKVDGEGEAGGGRKGRGRGKRGGRGKGRTEA